MADKAAPEAKKSLRFIGGDARDDKTRKNESGEDPGRSDLTFIIAGMGCFIEVKNGEDGWTTRSSDPRKFWTRQQREWARLKVTAERPTPVWMWISVGPDQPHYNPLKFMPRKTWLVPYQDVIKVVEMMEVNGHSTLPYRVKKRTRTFFKERNLSCETAFAGYELKWCGNRIWSIPEDHKFYREYINAE